MDERRRGQRLAASLLFAQAIAVFVWWLWLTAEPSAPGHFVGPLLPASALRTYLLPDLALYGGLGLLTASLLAKDHPYSWPCLLLLGGGILYATLSTIALAVQSQGGWIGIPLMTVSAAITLGFAWRLRPR